MEILTKAFSALWQVLAVGLLLGAGIPALFSIGMRSLERGRVPAPAGATNASTDGTVAGTGRQGRCRRLLRRVHPGRAVRHRRDHLRQAALQLSPSTENLTNAACPDSSAPS